MLLLLVLLLLVVAVLAVFSRPVAVLRSLDVRLLLAVLSLWNLLLLRLLLRLLWRDLPLSWLRHHRTHNLLVLLRPPNGRHHRKLLRDLAAVGPAAAASFLRGSLALLGGTVRRGRRRLSLLRVAALFLLGISLGILFLVIASLILCLFHVALVRFRRVLLAPLPLFAVAPLLRAPAPFPFSGSSIRAIGSLLLFLILSGSFFLRLVLGGFGRGGGTSGKEQTQCF